jgi:hypothetical protein
MKIHMHTTDCVQYGKDAHSHIGEDGSPHIGNSESTEEENKKLDSDGKVDVLFYNAEAFL